MSNVAVALQNYKHVHRDDVGLVTLAFDLVSRGILKKQDHRPTKKGEECDNDSLGRAM